MEEEVQLCYLCGIPLGEGEVDDFAGLCYHCYIQDSDEDEEDVIWKGVYGA
jgi:NMD protein affecting ribosome stability and mRNA decay